MNDRVSYRVADGIATLELVRPGGNALDLAMGSAFRDAAAQLAADADAGQVRVGVIRAQGRLFCVGGDLAEFGAAADRGAAVRTVADLLHEGIATIRSLSIPVVSVVHATAAGAGVGLALLGDIVVAADEAKFVMAYTASGLTPDCGVSWFTGQRLTSVQAMDLLLTNRPLTGRMAAEWGLVSRAVPAADLDAEVQSLLETLQAGPVEAFAHTKRLVAEAKLRPLVQQLTDEAATIEAMITAPDGTEGVDAFLGKRRPTFGHSG